MPYDLPTWQPLPSKIIRDANNHHPKPQVNDDDDNNNNKNDNTTDEDEELLTSFGNRESHVAAFLSPSSFLVCFGGWVESSGSEEVLGIDMKNPAKGWQILGKSEVAFRANCSLSQSSRTSSFAVLFGGLDLDSYDCTNDAFIVSMKMNNGDNNDHESSMDTNPSISFKKLAVDDSSADSQSQQQQQPCPRHRHSACISASTNELIIFGGEDDDNNLLNDFWALDLTKAEKEGVASWRKLEVVNNTNGAAVPTPHAASKLFSTILRRENNTNHDEFLCLAGGLVSDDEEDGTTESSCNEVYVMKRIEGGIAIVSHQREFFPAPVNCLLSASLSPSETLLFGGKDGAKGNDDMMVVSIVDAGDDKAGSVISLKVVSVLKCPFVEEEKIDTHDEAISRLDRKGSRNCWPHWRYLADVASWKQPGENGSSSTFVACVGGTCRHVDPGCEVVIARF